MPGPPIDLAAARRLRRPPELARPRRRRVSRPYGLVVRVDLVDADPAVWRRLELPSTLRLDQLHVVMQAAFDWDDAHLHRFSLGSSAWGHDGEVFLCGVDVEEGDTDGVPEQDVRLDEVLREVGEGLLYVYDYGDDWTHQLVVEQVVGVVERPRCLAAAGGAPPEDSGGILAWNDRPGRAPEPDQAQIEQRLAAELAHAVLPAEIGALLRQLAGLPEGVALADLVERAELHLPVDVAPATAAEMVRRYAWLVRRLGAGLALTQAGWLPPAVVTEAMDALWPDDQWIGKRNREDLTEPVRRLRASAQRLGLLRVQKGRLLGTRAGATLVDDPSALWRHVAERAGAGARSPFDRTATALRLLALAAGGVPERELLSVLSAAGWSGRGGALPPYALSSGSAALGEVLDVTGALTPRSEPTPGGRTFARGALTALAR